MTLMGNIMAQVRARGVPLETPAPPPSVMPPRTRTRRRLFPETPEEVQEPVPAFERRPRRTGPVPADDRHLDKPWGPNFFKDHLKRSDSRSERSRVGTDYVHVSSLVDFCGRAHNLAATEGVLLDPPPTGGHRVMWEIGKAVERHVRNGIIAARNGVGCLGVWRCPCGQLEHTGERSLAPCPRCEHAAEDYFELTLRDHEAGVAGNPDFAVFIGPRVAPLEIKSMNKADWDALNAPQPDHVFQVLSYDRLFRRSGYETIGEAALIYVTKDFKWGDPYKEFHVPTGQREHEAILDMAWREATDVKRARDAGEVLPRVRCRAITQPRAKACPVSAQCFMRSR